eukprot:8965551-Pyramimonas_sp.AAC.1
MALAAGPSLPATEKVVSGLRWFSGPAPSGRTWPLQGLCNTKPPAIAPKNRCPAFSSAFRGESQLGVHLMASACVPEGPLGPAGQGLRPPVPRERTRQ